MKETLKESWDTYWMEHQQTGYINYTPELIQTITCLLDVRGERILEIGVGTGGNSSTLAKLGAEVYVLDFSRRALQISMSTAGRLGVHFHFVECDARHLPFETGSFDLVFHQGFLEHFSEPGPLVSEQRRVLKDGGYLLVDVPQKYSFFTIRKHWLMRLNRWEYGGWETEFSYTALCRLLQSLGFKVVAAYGRGYYPRLFHMLRHLYKAEAKLIGRCFLPEWIWERYRAFWLWFERSALGLHTLQCLGVVGQKR